jgi:hypothetical protein
MMIYIIILNSHSDTINSLIFLIYNYCTETQSNKYIDIVNCINNMPTSRIKRIIKGDF